MTIVDGMRALADGARRVVATGEQSVDVEADALRRLAEQVRASAARTPLDALQHVVDVAREMARGTYGALAVTGTNDYVEGFVVSGVDAAALSALKTAPQGHGPLGSMRQDGLPVRLDDVSRHARAFGFPPKHPVMKALLGVPIFASGEVRGALYVTDRRDGEAFNDRDEAALRVLARHAGLIVAASWY
jgi:GAF domain-containing protein